MKRYCKYCGSELEEGFDVCCNCGKTDKGDKETKAKINANISNPDYKKYKEDKEYSDHNYNKKVVVDDSGSFGWFIFGLFFGLIGFILAIVWSKEKPKNSKMVLFGALIGVILSWLFKASAFSFFNWFGF
ncbi:MAG: hypothetical protein PHO86_02430 [Bacilli bacterium]|nr:hypothetical protein [Bacilli bacterium]